MVRKNEEKNEALAMAAKIMERFAGVEGQEAKSGRLRGIDFRTLDGFESPEVLKELGKNHRGWIPLHKMHEMISDTCKFHFFKTVFENRDCIPRKELLKVWYCFQEGNFRTYYSRDIISSPEWISTITDPLLIDNWSSRCWYVNHKKPGWRFLNCTMEHNTATIRLSSALSKAIDEDNVPMFEMVRNMEGSRICFSMLMMILNGRKFSILKHLVANGGIPKDVMTVEELCCYCTAWFPDAQSVPVLNAIEEARPGLLKSVHDSFGRNLLWYAVFNNYTGWFHPKCALTSFLLKNGCDPDNSNQIGLSWREITNNLTQQQKMQLMHTRYGHSKAFLWKVKRNIGYMFNIKPLNEIQPLKYLKKKKKW